MSSSSDEEEFLDIEDINNGLILCDTFLPEEVLLNLFIFVSWNDLLSCRLVCQSWKRIIDSDVSFEKLKTFSPQTLKQSFSEPPHLLKTDSVPFYLYFAVSKGAFGKNLLKNGFGSGSDPHICQWNRNAWREISSRGEDRHFNRMLCSQIDCPKYKHWLVTELGGDGWAVESEPQGSEPLPNHLPERSCFVTSYHWCSKEQLITLSEHGLKDKIMDEVQPQLDISEWYARRWDCTISYKLNVLLLDSNRELVTNFDIQTGQDLQDNAWHEVSHSFNDYGPGVRYILFIHSGRDGQFWAGHYGSKIAGGSVIARIPASRYIRPCDSSLQSQLCPRSDFTASE